MDTRSALRLLLGLMGVAVAVSVVHYVDNTVNYADYPQADPGTALAAVSPSQTVVAAGWFIFTAFGVLGVWLFIRGRIAAAAVAIAVYSGSGLVGFGHYAVPGATDMVWWRQAHVDRRHRLRAVAVRIRPVGGRGVQAFASVPR